MYSHFLRPDDPHPTEILTDGAVHVLAAAGVDRFSIGAIARWMRVTPAAVLKQRSRDEILEVVIVRFGERWLHWCRPVMAEDLPTLPSTDEERHGVRVHLALLEIARGQALTGNPAPEQHIAATRADELVILDSWLRRRWGRPASSDELEALSALVTGLRLALVAPGSALTWEKACEILRRHLSGSV